MTTLRETTPTMDLAIQDIAHLVEELRASHALYSPLFQRREQREAASPYLQGLLAPLPRKSIEPMVLAVDGVAPKAVRAMQALLSERQWNDARLVPQPWQEVETGLGAAEGVRMVDGSAFPKQGVHAGGVQRQSCGDLGKRAQCQAGVWVGAVSSPGSTLRARRVEVPADWCPDDASMERRRQCGVPPARPCTTTPALAQERRAAVLRSPTRRSRWVVAEEAFGGKPGFLEVDLVAHCGDSSEGFYLTTLSAVDVATGWYEPVAVWGKGQDRVGGAVYDVRQRLPMPMLGLDSDNGSEFINQSLYDYCRRNAITFTRARSYKKNDSCHVEQKNWSIVRRTIGYDRFSSKAAFEALDDAYTLIRLYVNFFQPVLKLVGKSRHGAKVRKVYDTAQTPYQRLLRSGVLMEQKRRELAAIYAALNPVTLLKQIRQEVEHLWTLAERQPSLSSSVH